MHLVGVSKEAFDNYPLNCIGGAHTLVYLSLSWNNKISHQIIMRFCMTSYNAISDSDGGTCVYGQYHCKICSGVSYSARTLPFHTQRTAGPMNNRVCRVYCNSLNGLTTALFWVVTQGAVTQDSAVFIYFAVES